MTVHRGLGGIRSFGSAGLAMVMAVLLVAPAFACTATGGSISVRPARAEAGTGIDVVGTGFEGQAGASQVDVRWGGASGQLLAQVSPDEAGAFSQRITVPATAQPGWHQVTASQKRLNADTFAVSNFAFEVTGIPAPAPAPAATPAPAPAPAPVADPAPVQPVAAATPAPAPAARPAPVATRPATQAAIASSPAPVAPAPVPAAAPDPGLQLSELRDTDPAGVGPTAGPIEPLVVSDPAAMGGPRSIDSGPPLWMLIPLVLVGLTLFSASCAVVVNEVRTRRSRARVQA